MGNKKINSFGFTLIELLVVVSIIGILATLLVANYNATRQRARDAQRKSDLRNIQAALRVYYNDKGSFPSSNGGKIAGCGSGSTVCNWGSSFSASGVVYMNVLPKDPSSDRSYYYDYDSGTGEYVLYTCLENKADDKCMSTSCSPSRWSPAPSGCEYYVKP